MTKEEIDILWNKAIRESVDDGSLYTRYRFAELVAEAERKAMMQLFTDPENQPTQHGTVIVEYMQREIAAAKAEEREACAKVCEDDFGNGASEKCAAAIRARSNT